MIPNYSLQQKIQLKSWQGPTHTAVSPDGRVLAIPTFKYFGHLKTILRGFSTDTGTQLWERTFYLMCKILFSADGSSLIVSSHQENVSHWTLENKEVTILDSLKGEVLSLWPSGEDHFAITPDNTEIWSGRYRDINARDWSGHKLRNFKLDPGEISAIAVSPDSALVVVALRNVEEILGAHLRNFLNSHRYETKLLVLDRLTGEKLTSLNISDINCQCLNISSLFQEEIRGQRKSRITTYGHFHNLAESGIRVYELSQTLPEAERSPTETLVSIAPLGSTLTGDYPKWIDFAFESDHLQLLGLSARLSPARSSEVFYNGALIEGLHRDIYLSPDTHQIVFSDLDEHSVTLLRNRLSELRSEAQIILAAAELIAGFDPSLSKEKIRTAVTALYNVIFEHTLALLRKSALAERVPFPCIGRTTMQIQPQEPKKSGCVLL